jgi:hypothetical protein
LEKFERKEKRMKKNIFVIFAAALACAAALFTACPQSTDDSTPPVQYTITVDDLAVGGSVSAPAKAAANEKVTLTVALEDGYEVKYLFVEGVNGRVSLSEETANESYWFYMPACDVTVRFDVVSATAQTYQVTKGALEHGGLTLSHANAAEGVEVTITPEPDPDYELASLSVKQKGDPYAAVQVTKVGSSYVFSMPAYEVEVTAQFVSAAAEKKDISLAPDIENGSVQLSHSSAAAGTVVSISAAPSAGYRVKTGDGVAVSLVDGENETPLAVTAAGVNLYTFTVSDGAGSIVVTVTFEALPLHTITIDDGLENGGITTSPAGETYETALVTVTVTPDSGYLYYPGSLKVTGASNSEIAYSAGASDGVFTFGMPEENVTITAQFLSEAQAESLHNVTVTAPDAYGSIEVNVSKALLGDTVTITLKPQSGDHRYKAGTLAVTYGEEQSAGTEGPVEDGINRKYTFTMPDADVTVSAQFELIPTYQVSAASIANGEITTSAAYVRAGTVVTITLTVNDPDTYRCKAGTITVTKAGGGTLETAPVEEQTNKWTFSMPANEDAADDVTVSAEIEAIPTYTLTVNDAGVAGKGTLAVNPSGPVKAETEVTITLTVSDTENYRYQEGSLTLDPSLDVTPDAAGPGTFTWTFTMPAEDTAEDVTLSAVIEAIPTYALNLTQPDYGTLSASPTGPVKTGTLVTLTLSFDDDEYRYTAASIAVVKANKGGSITPAPDSTEEPLSWTFSMPESEADADDLDISAGVEAIPTHTVTQNFTVDDPSGSITVSPLVEANTKAKEGKTLTITVTINDEEEYQLQNGAPAVAKTVGGDVSITPAGAGQWTFVMPAEAVTITAAIQTRPYIKITKGETSNGSFTITANYGTNAVVTGDYDTRSGKTFTISADPDWAYKAVSTGPTSTNGGEFTPIDENTWTFTMGDEATTVAVPFEFRSESVYELYKGKYGGFNPNVEQDRMVWGNNYWEDTEVEWETVSGRNGGYALRTTGAHVNSVGLKFINSHTVSLTDVKALSFWAKVTATGGGATANPFMAYEFAGFGSGNNVVLLPLNGTLTAGEWTQFIIPVPAPSDASINDWGFFMRANGGDKDLIFDDIEFIKDDVSLASVAIQPTYAAPFEYPGPTDISALFANVQYSATYQNTAGTVSTTLVNNVVTLGQTFKFSNWATPTLSVDGDAIYQAGNVTTTSLGGAFNVYLTLDGVRSNPMSCTVTDSVYLALENFEAAANGNFGSSSGLGYQEFGAWTGVSDSDSSYVIDGRSGRIYNTFNGGGAGRKYNDGVKDISGFDTISIQVKSTVTPIEGDTYTLWLLNNTDDWYGMEFTIDAQGAVETKTWELTEWTVSNPGLSLTAIAGWKVTLLSGDNGDGNTARSIGVDNINVYQTE